MKNFYITKQNRMKRGFIPFVTAAILAISLFAAMPETVNAATYTANDEATFQTALASCANSGDVIQLTTTVTLTGNYTIAKDITIDLNGEQLSFYGNMDFSNGVTFSNSGADSPIYINGPGSLVVSGGNFDVLGPNVVMLFTSSSTLDLTGANTAAIIGGLGWSNGAKFYVNDTPSAAELPAMNTQVGIYDYFKRVLANTAIPTIGFTGTTGTHTLHLYNKATGQVIGTITYDNDGVNPVVWTYTPAPSVCEFAGVQYTDFALALADAQAAGGGTITLLQSSTYTYNNASALTITTPVTIATAGFTLNVENTGDAGLIVNNGSVALTGAGAFNVKGQEYGLYVDNSTVTVTNVENTGPNHGVYADNGSNVTVTGNVTAKFVGVYADNATVNVQGNVSGDDGVLALNNGAVTVGGNVTGNTFYGGAANTGGKVYVVGTITGATNAVSVNNTVNTVTNTGVTLPSPYNGYYWDEYTDGTSYVYKRQGAIPPPPVVNAATPTITAQPQNATVTTGSSVTLSVTATVPAGVLSYQWYNGNGTAIPGATASTYSPPTTKAGIYTYYVVVTNTNNSATGTKTATATSNTVTVTVNADVNPPVPPVVQRQIIISQPPEGVLVQPSAGVHYVEIYHDFTFRLTFLNRKIYEVHTDRLTPAGKQEELVGKKNANGEYEYTIHNVIAQPVYVYIGPNTLGSVANDNVEKAAVWSYGNTLYIQSSREDVASVYSISGMLVKRIDVPEGGITQPLAKGVYIVTLKDGSAHKVIIK